MDSLWPLLSAFFPPVLTPSYLRALLPPVVETLGLAAGSMFLAFLISLPLGIAAGLRLPGTRPLLAVLSAVRAIPDLTVAILCVILFGVGPGAGLLALAIYYGAVVAKMFADILRTAPRPPLEALAATGARRLQLALFGLLPLKRADLLTYGAYEFESALRASIVVGAVGGGGLGSELVGSLAALDFPRVTTQLIVLVTVVAVLDQLAVWLRRHPRWLLALAPLGLAALAAYAPRLLAFDHALHVFGEMFPPRLTERDWAALLPRLWETAWMALAGTGGAVLAAALFGALTARNLAPPWLAWPLRRLMEVLRSIPEVVWGLILIAVAGVGPTAGAAALGLHSAGCLARLFAESLENAPRAPQLAIAGTGASAVVVTAWATVPLALGPVAVHSLFRLEWNLRMATVMGLIGAGGIGQALYDAQQLFFYRQMMAYILITWVLVALVDNASEALRRRYKLNQIPA
ncbi:MAG: ABC transporter permease subunit [Nevskia sp.]|nr:ABC transporter permease subunit [Nevskia sp.]